MGKELGVLFRTLRKRQGLTQQQLAGKARISLRAVTYWEAGEREPRVEELQCALRALNVTREEQEQAYLLMTSSRGLQLVQQQVKMEAPSGRRADSIPDIGDLLRALRLRRGWTRQQVAAEMKLEFSTISRWERMENLPNDENLDRLCKLLNAELEERLALMTHCLSPQCREQNWSQEAAMQSVQEFCDEVDLGVMSLIDLHALSLKRRLWLSMRTAPCFEVLLGRVETAHSLWLLDQNRVAEAGACANRAIKLSKARPGECDFIERALNIASYHAVKQRNDDPNAGREFLSGHLSNGYQRGTRAMIYCDMALYASAGGKHVDALNLLQQARCHNDLAGCIPTLDWYCRQTLARVLAKAGRFRQALEALPQDDNITGRNGLFPNFVRADILWQAGQSNEAHTILQKLYADLARYPSVGIQQMADRLAQQM